jgi:hypothetical protein
MDNLDRQYWIEFITRLVRKDYRPEPTLPESNQGFFNAVSDTFDEPSGIEKTNANQTIDNISLKKGLSFAQMLFQFIDEKRMDEVKLYQFVGISRSVFSKIRSRDAYQPDKDTVFKFAIGLKLNIEEGIIFLASAGFNFKLSSNRDLIIRHCLKLSKFDLLLVDQLLVRFKEKTLFSEK